MEHFDPINGNFSAIIVDNNNGRIMGAMRIDEGSIESCPSRYLKSTITISGREISYKEAFLLIKTMLDTYTFETGRYPFKSVADEYEFGRRTKIEKVIFNDPATIVIWKDGSKTVVKCGEGDVFDPEKGLALCFMKRILGNKGNFNNVIREWIPEDSELSESATNSLKHMAEVLRDSLSTVNMGLVAMNLEGKED